MLFIFSFLSALGLVWESCPCVATPSGPGAAWSPKGDDSFQLSQSPPPRVCTIRRARLYTRPTWDAWIAERKPPSGSCARSNMLPLYGEVVQLTASDRRWDRRILRWRTSKPDLVADSVPVPPSRWWIAWQLFGLETWQPAHPSKIRRKRFILQVCGFLEPKWHPQHLHSVLHKNFQFLFRKKNKNKKRLNCVHWVRAGARCQAYFGVFRGARTATRADSRCWGL